MEEIIERNLTAGVREPKISKYHTIFIISDISSATKSTRFSQSIYSSKQTSIIKRSVKGSFSGNSVKLFDCRAFVYLRPCMPSPGYRVFIDSERFFFL